MRVFISYRRQETKWLARSLFDRLTAKLGESAVFMDVHTLKPGDNFAEAISAAVCQCDAMLVLIGSQWDSISDSHGRRRLENPQDLVRLEVSTALRNGIRVVPILVDGAALPPARKLPSDLAAMTRHHALEINERSYQSVVEKLFELPERNHAGKPPTLRGRLWTMLLRFFGVASARDARSPSQPYIASSQEGWRI